MQFLRIKALGVFNVMMLLRLKKIQVFKIARFRIWTALASRTDLLDDISREPQLMYLGGREIW